MQRKASAAIGSVDTERPDTAEGMTRVLIDGNLKTEVTSRPGRLPRLVDGSTKGLRRRRKREKDVLQGGWSQRWGLQAELSGGGFQPRLDVRKGTDTGCEGDDSNLLTTASGGFGWEPVDEISLVFFHTDTDSLVWRGDGNLGVQPCADEEQHETDDGAGPN